MHVCLIAECWHCGPCMYAYWALANLNLAVPACLPALFARRRRRMRGAHHGRSPRGRPPQTSCASCGWQLSSIPSAASGCFLLTPVLAHAECLQVGGKLLLHLRRQCHLLAAVPAHHRHQPPQALGHAACPCSCPLHNHLPTADPCRPPAAGCCAAACCRACCAGRRPWIQTGWPPASIPSSHTAKT